MNFLSKRLGLMLSATIFPALLFAQDFPAKQPLRIIVPYPAGGITDRIARDTAAEMQKRIKQTVMVENKAGAAGNIGFEYASRQPADGYTLVMAPASNLTVQSELFKKLPYSLERDFAPLSLLVVTPQVLVTHPSVQAKSVKELVELSKKTPGKVNYGATIGSYSHLAGEHLRAISGADFTNVPYQGFAPAINDLIGGQTQFMFNEVTAVYQNVDTGKLKAIAVAYKTRSPLMPNVPTFAEAGFPDFEVTSWYALIGRAGTPKPVMDLLAKTLQEIMKDPDFKKRYADIGALTVGSTPDELAAFIKSESVKWTELIKKVGIEPN
jgi:tripartite-type tricarboxylate transporter receptor subunit TctC